MTGKIGSPITFECDFCGNVWECERDEYKIQDSKTTGGKHWRKFIAKCPICHRAVSLTTQIQHKPLPK